ncbi:MAG TPA: sugar ABC transporter substrate-binding protein [Verrucomicrobiales bacterium]|nr:sugar ABC transporter substrate-binding protein [Verrucomicrobiales bacterium]
MKKIIQLTGAVLAATLIGCGGGGSETKLEKPVIGYTTKDLSNPFFNIIGDTLKTEAAKHGYDVIVVDGGDRAETQDKQIDDFISRKVKAIVVSPCDSKSVGASIRKANKAGIPVFTVDLACTDETAEIVSHVETDNYGGGKLAGEAMVKAIGAAGGKVLILHLATADSCVQRVRGFTEVIEAHNQKNENARIVITETLPGGGNQQDSKKSTAAFVQGNKDLRAIFAINDPSALGAYAALKQAGMEGKVTIVGFDGEKAGKQAIKDGKIFADPIQYPDEMARITMDSILKYIDGRKPERVIKIPAKLYYKEDADKDPDLK